MTSLGAAALLARAFSDLSVSATLREAPFAPNPIAQPRVAEPGHVSEHFPPIRSPQDGPTIAQLMRPIGSCSRCGRSNRVPQAKRGRPSEAPIAQSERPPGSSALLLTLLLDAELRCRGYRRRPGR